MKRMHLHVGVDNLEEAVRFYSALFGTAPSKHKSDYAKWMLDDPRLNFAISTRVSTRGLDHVGLQVDDEVELAQLRERISAAGLQTVDDGETVCCYARSDKSWLHDPAGIAWEAYRTMEDAQIFNGREAAASASAAACCVPPAAVAMPTPRRKTAPTGEDGCS